MYAPGFTGQFDKSCAGPAVVTVAVVVAELTVVVVELTVVVTTSKQTASQRTPHAISAGERCAVVANQNQTNKCE
jgi:hypothetical protein